MPLSLYLEVHIRAAALLIDLAQIVHNNKLPQLSLLYKYLFTMRIAIVAPLFEHIPPARYGGTERMIYYLVEELVALGHSVTLYATNDSKTSAYLFPCYSGTLRERGIGPRPEETERTYTAQLKLACSESAGYDIVHVHHGTYPYHPALLETIRNVPIVWTDHNAVHNDGKPEIFKQIAKLGIKVTALSSSHRNTVPNAPWLATIFHSLPINLLTASFPEPSYLALLGRISPEKGICTAVWIADRAGMKLKVAAKVDAVDSSYYENEVKPLFLQSNVSFVGEITEREKGPFLGAAIALIFPICWEKPFGLVMIEAMACGCPVIAFNRGSVPEIIEDGVTGFIIESKEEACEVLKKVPNLDRKRIRKRFEERFVSTNMAGKYVEAYKSVIRAFNVTRDTSAVVEKGAALGTGNGAKITTIVRTSFGQMASLDGISNRAWAKQDTGHAVEIVREFAST
jgi:glycosyltransferase involved in cell wall biosynthesis